MCGPAARNTEFRHLVAETIVVSTVGVGRLWSAGKTLVLECVMTQSTSRLLTSVFETVRDMKEMYGPNDQDVVHAKQLEQGCEISEFRLDGPLDGFRARFSKRNTLEELNELCQIRV
jgi:hypothetical protein